MSDKGNGSGERLDSKVIPVMREAVATVQLVLFGQLKEKLTDQYGDLEQADYTRFVGCIVNDLFGTPPQEKESVEFVKEHFDEIERELWKLKDYVPDLIPFLTDALRMQTLCDHEEGENSLPTLIRAQALGVLQEERTVPMPSTFMLATRQLGATYGLVEPMKMQDSSAE